MPASAVNRLLGQISRSVVAEQFAEFSDAELLSRIKSGDAAALETVVRRHGGMVLAAARSVLSDDADIDDAFQAAFLALWRGAGRIRKSGSLGPWLFGVARRVALKALTRSARHRRIESMARAKQDGDADPSWREACHILHEEIERLPEHYRGPIVLCYLEGRTRDEAAEDLGWKVATLRGRLERGRNMLKRRLTRRGIGLAVGCWAWLAEDATAPACELPARLVDKTVRVVGCTTAGVPVRILELLPAKASAIRAKVIFGAVAMIVASLLSASSSGKSGSDSKTASAADRFELILQDEPVEPLPEAAFAGAWIVDSAFRGRDSHLRMIWNSILTVAGDSFALSKFLDLPKDLKGKFTLDPRADPKRIDLKFDGLDLSETGMPAKITAGTLLGIYKLEGDRLTICFRQKAGGERPKDFNSDSIDVYRLSFKKAAIGFKGLPKDVTIRVIGPDGNPVAGATVAGFMNLQKYRQNENDKLDWTYSHPSKTEKDGTVRLHFDDMPSDHLIVRDLERKLMAFVGLSPASVMSGETTVKLLPERSIVGTMVCPELEKAGKPLQWTSAYLMLDGDRVAYCNAPNGQFEFVAPPGKYVVHAYGSDLHGKNVTITVPADPSQFVVDPIELVASPLLLLKGNLAQEPKGVLAWKGQPTKLSDLKGKYVLLDFWGWWCGPCVQSMPVLIELYEKFAAKGLAVVGVHVDVDGEVDTVAKLDEKLTQFRKDLWHGKDLPFPVALVSGKDVGDGEQKYHSEVCRQFGVLSYPTTILIDREGKIVGRFGALDIKSATAQVEKLLAEKK